MRRKPKPDGEDGQTVLLFCIIGVLALILLVMAGEEARTMLEQGQHFQWRRS